MASALRVHDSYHKVAVDSHMVALLQCLVGRCTHVSVDVHGLPGVSMDDSLNN